MHIYIYIYIYIRFIQYTEGFFAKIKIMYFFKFFFHKCKFCIIWNWYIVKIILISEKIFVLKPFKTDMKQADSSKNQQRSAINFLLAEMYKQCEIYRTCAYSEKCVLVKRIFTNGLIMGLLFRSWVKMRIHELETQWLSGKEKVLGVVASKRKTCWHVFWNMKGLITWFSWKKVQLETVFFLA